MNGGSLKATSFVLTFWGAEVGHFKSLFSNYNFHNGQLIAQFQNQNWIVK